MTISRRPLKPTDCPCPEERTYNRPSTNGPLSWRAIQALMKHDPKGPFTLDLSRMCLIDPYGRGGVEGYTPGQDYWYPVKYLEGVLPLAGPSPTGYWLLENKNDTVSLLYRPYDDAFADSYYSICFIPDPAAYWAKIDAAQKTMAPNKYYLHPNLFDKKEGPYTVSALPGSQAQRAYSLMKTEKWGIDATQAKCPPHPLVSDGVANLRVLVKQGVPWQDGKPNELWLSCNLWILCGGLNHYKLYYGVQDQDAKWTFYESLDFYLAPREKTARYPVNHVIVNNPAYLSYEDEAVLGPFIIRIRTRSPSPSREDTWHVYHRNLETGKIEPYTYIIKGITGKVKAKFGIRLKLTNTDFQWEAGRLVPIGNDGYREAGPYYINVRDDKQRVIASRIMSTEGAFFLNYMCFEWVKWNPKYGRWDPNTAGPFCTTPRQQVSSTAVGPSNSRRGRKTASRQQQAFYNNAPLSQTVVQPVTRPSGQYPPGQYPLWQTAQQPAVQQGTGQQTGQPAVQQVTGQQTGQPTVHQVIRQRTGQQTGQRRVQTGHHTGHQPGVPPPRLGPSWGYTVRAAAHNVVRKAANNAGRWLQYALAKFPAPQYPT